MINWKATLIFLCIFLAGGVAGGFVGMRIGCNKAKVKPEPTAQAQNPQRRPIDEWTKRQKKEFIERLSIPPEQEAKLDPVFQDAQAELRVYREQFSEQTNVVMKKLDGQLMALLTDEQKSKYEQLIKERQERKKKMDADRAAAAARGDRPPGPPPPGGKPFSPPPSGDKQVPPPPSTGTPSPAPSETPATPTPKTP